MLLVKTHIKSSPIHGIGLFASEFILKGTLVWRLVRGFDQVFTEEQFGKLPQSAINTIEFYGYYQEEDGGYVLCADDARFFNHSKDPNCESKVMITYAARDIKAGEELTDNYEQFDGMFSLKDIIRTKF